MNRKSADYGRAAGLTRSTRLKTVLVMVLIFALSTCGFVLSVTKTGVFSTRAHAEENVNLVYNGNLEYTDSTGTCPAGFYYSYDVGKSLFTVSHAAEGADGGKAAKIVKKTASSESLGTARLSTGVISVEGLVKYTLTYKIKATISGDVKIYSRWVSGTQNASNKDEVTATTAGFATKTARIPAPDGAQYMRIEFVVTGSGSATVLIDDISLTKYVFDPSTRENLVLNPDFEELEGGFPKEWTKWETVAEQSANVSYSIVTGGDAYSGNSLKIVNASTVDNRAVLNNTAFEVDGGATYQLSFYYKSDSPSAKNSFCLRQFKANGQATTKNNYYWNDSATVTGTTSGWKKVMAVFQLEPDAFTAFFQVDIAPTGNAAVYYDSFFFERIEVDEVNKGFEKTEGTDEVGGWLFSETESVSFADDVYHDGKNSLHVQRKDYFSDFTASTIGTLEVVSGRTYEIGFYMRSQNSLDAKALLKIELYNGANQRTMFLDSPYVFLKSGEGLSDWTKVFIRYVMPADTFNVRCTVTIKTGVADCYIDGLFCYDVETVAYRNDLESISESGVAAGFTGDAESFKDGKISLAANKQVTTEFYGALYGYGYTFTGELNAEGAARPVIAVEWINFRGERAGYTEYPLIEEDSAFTFDFLAPSAAYAKLYFKNAGSGTVTLDNLQIEKTYDPVVDATGWKGQWICYPATDIAYGLEYQNTYYRKTFTLEEEVSYARLQVTGDDVTTSYVNGNELEDPGKNAWADLLVINVTNLLTVGENVLAFKIYNQTYYTGVLFDLEIVTVSGKTLRVYSDEETLSMDNAIDGTVDWINAVYDASDWKKIHVVGPVTCQPWGNIPYERSTDALPSATLVSVTLPASVKAGEKLEFSVTFEIKNRIEDDFSFRVFFRPWLSSDEEEVIGAWIVPEITGGLYPTEWVVGELNEVTFSVFVPDFIATDTYMIQFDPKEFYIDNDEDGFNPYYENIIRGEYFDIENPGTVELKKTEIKNIDGTARLLIDGEPVAPMMYLREQTTVFETEYASGMAGAGVDLMCLPNCRIYNMNNAGSMWKGEGRYDFSALDNVVYETLQGAPDALLMLMLDADPPTWWLNAHPDSVIYVKNSKNVYEKKISYASKEWREDVGKFYEAFLEYAMNQPWSGHVYSVKISAGATFEWQYYGHAYSATEPTCADTSRVATTEFRAWLKNKYETVEALRKAWGNNTVTFETANVPTFDERKPTTYNTLLDGKTQRNVLDVHYFLCDMVTDSILYLAKVVKETTGNQWVVGTYNGYLTNVLTWEGAGLANASISRVLESEYIDFLCAPVCYDERNIGMSASYMMMVDSVIAAGKMAIIECDSRTVYFDSKSTPPATLGEWGKTYTVKATLESMKRDFVNMMIKGAGLWWYDMYGGWFNDPEIYDLISVMSKEWERAAKEPVENTAKIAFVVGDDIATAMAYDFDGSYDYLYQSLYWQKESLAHIGAQFDLLYASSFANGFMRDYDVYLVVAVDLTEEQIAGINEKVKKDGKTVIWVGFPGIYGAEGEMSAERVSSVTDITLAFAPSGTSYGVEVTANEGFAQGVKGYIYGKPSSVKVNPMLVVTDENATVLGKIYGTQLTGLAVKTVELEGGGSYTSVYSSVGNVPAAFIRNVLKNYGVTPVGEEGGDAVYQNGNYIAIASLYGGTKTITLDKPTFVYDVFNGKVLGENVSTVTIEMEAGTTVLIRTGEYAEPIDPDDPDNPDNPDDPDNPVRPNKNVLGAGEIVAITAACVITVGSVVGGVLLDKRKKRMK